MCSKWNANTCIVKSEQLTEIRVNFQNNHRSFWKAVVFFPSAAKKHGIDDISSDVANLVSHATQERLRDLLEKLDTIAEHRIEIYKVWYFCWKVSCKWNLECENYIFIFHNYMFIYISKLYPGYEMCSLPLGKFLWNFYVNFDLL